jgi:hypothetical protein
MSVRTLAVPRAQQEWEHLVQADRHIAAGEKHVTDQRRRIEAMTAKSRDTAEAERLLQTFEDIVEGWRRHRGVILAEIRRLEGSDP